MKRAAKAGWLIRMVTTDSVYYLYPGSYYKGRVEFVTSMYMAKKFGSKIEAQKFADQHHLKVHQLIYMGD